MTALPAHAEVAWHDAECGRYRADLGTWRELAAAHGDGGVLDLGAGSGRVALDLARAGFDVTAVDRDEALCRALHARAKASGLGLAVERADARELDLGRDFGLVLAPMQLTQVVGERDDRLRLLAAVVKHLAPGGVAAFALVEEVQHFEPGGADLLPDVCEANGWVYASTPVAARADGSGIELVRHREAVGPDGRRIGEETVVRLAWCPPEELEAEAGAIGLRPLRRLRIAATDDHVGSAVVVLERG